MLTGYRVLDLTQVVAGPTATRLLAEMGAEVVKVELAPAGDHGRQAGLKPRDPRFAASSASTHFAQHNHSKRTLAVDLKQEAGRALLRRLAGKVDVLVENFAPGVMARAGLDYATLAALHPGLIMCSISMAGQTGPLADKPGFDYMAAAYAGITGLMGEADRAPAQLGAAMGDNATGLAAAMAIAVALLHRERTGEGQYIEASLIDTYFQMHEVNVPRVSLRGPSGAPHRAGALHGDGGPTGVFRHGADSFIAIMVLPHQWRQLVAALGMPELAADPRFASPRGRRENNVALATIIEAWLAGFPTREAAIAALEAHRVPCAPVLSVAEAIAHPHLRARGTVREMDDPRLGRFAIPGPPVRFSRWAWRDAPRAGLLGEDNEAVLAELGGLDAAEIAALVRDKVLVRDPLLDVPPPPEQDD